MKNITKLILLFSALLFFFNKCSKDENNPMGPDGPLVDPLTNLWTDTSLADHTFDLTTYDSLVSRGIFFGTESHPDSNVPALPSIHGYFDKTYVEFDVIWENNFPRKRVKYKGNFVNSRLINLQSSEGKRLVISKN